MDTRLIQALRGDGSLEGLFLAITNLGSELWYIAILTGLYLLMPAVGRQIGVWFGLSVTLNTALKEAFHLPRPYQIDSSLATEAARATGPGPGLPSGHAQNAAFIWGALALQVRTPWFWGIAMILTGLIAFSRLYLGVHFLEDALLGLALGAALAALTVAVRVPRVNGLTALGLLVALGGVTLLASEDWGRQLGILWGFLAAEARFSPPKTLPLRIIFVIGGLILAFGLYLGSSALLPTDWKRSGLGSFLRYALLTFTLTELYPRLALGR